MVCDRLTMVSCCTYRIRKNVRNITAVCGILWLWLGGCLLGKAGSIVHVLTKRYLNSYRALQTRSQCSDEVVAVEPLGKRFMCAVRLVCDHGKQELVRGGRKRINNRPYLAQLLPVGETDDLLDDSKTRRVFLASCLELVAKVTRRKTQRSVHSVGLGRATSALQVSSIACRQSSAPFVASFPWYVQGTVNVLPNS